MPIAWLKRWLVALAGGVVASLLVAVVEGRSCALAITGAHPPSLASLVEADAGVLIPVGLAVGGMLGLVMIFLEPEGPRSWREYAAVVRGQPVLLRSRTAAIAPLAVFVACAWTTMAAGLARQLLASGGSVAAGIELALASAGLLVALAAVALAGLPSLRRVLAAGAEHAPRLLDPITTGGVALALAAGVIAWGVHAGDAGGEEGGALGIFGVLKRPELDLRPVVDLVAMAVGAYVAPIMFARYRVRVSLAAAAAVLAVGPILLTVHEARALDRDPGVGRALERGAPLGKLALAGLRRATDRDRDSASPVFGGGDCDDHDPRKNPNAIDVPGNGVDEDCSGADLPPPEPVQTAATTKQVVALPDDLNLILVTIDTLRPDLGFMGYDKPVSPNLDALAAKGVVFDRAYAMASYTGKSLGPLLIGKYPSETLRNGSHFNAYFQGNTFVTERLHAAGFRTFGAASHWYFAGWTGLAQGMDEWDSSAKPASGQGDTDTSVTSAELTNAALRLLARPGNTSGRFFMWLHYFDPHAQYDAHPGAPSFAVPGAKGFAAAQKAAYDGEVWFVDHHLGRVLDEVLAQPWGKKTAIVVTANHGEAFADHGMNWHGQEIWESLVRVPLLVYVPGVRPHHVPVKRSHIDLVPTLLDILRLPQPPPGELSGESMIGDVLADKDAAYPERDVYLDMPLGPYTGMRRGIIHGPTPGMKLLSFGGNSYNLYDLATDPGEADDLASNKALLAPVLAAFQAKRARLKEIEVEPEP